MFNSSVPRVWCLKRSNAQVYYMQWLPDCHVHLYDVILIQLMCGNSLLSDNIMQTHQAF